VQSESKLTVVVCERAEGTEDDCIALHDAGQQVRSECDVCVVVHGGDGVDVFLWG
jgi:hypothetical protein